MTTPIFSTLNQGTITFNLSAPSEEMVIQAKRKKDKILYTIDSDIPKFIAEREPHQPALSSLTEVEAFVKGRHSTKKVVFWQYAAVPEARPQKNIIKQIDFSPDELEPTHKRKVAATAAEPMPQKREAIMPEDTMLPSTALVNLVPTTDTPISSQVTEEVNCLIAQNKKKHWVAYILEPLQPTPTEV